MKGWRRRREDWRRFTKVFRFGKGERGKREEGGKRGKREEGGCLFYLFIYSLLLFKK